MNTKWCWICSNEGVGGSQDHDTKEHEEMAREGWRQMQAIYEQMENSRKHNEWLKKQPTWNPL